MKLQNKIIWTIVLLLVVIIGGIALKLGNYEVSQEYAANAARQLDDDSAYTLMKSQNGSNELLRIGYFVGALILLIVNVKIWLPRKP